jgi:hypothetical protein
MYNDLPFESMVQLPDGRILAAGDEGIYEYGYQFSDDDGAEIDAHLRFGYTDFRMSNRKQMEALYVGYTSLEPLKVELEAGDRVFEYTMDSHDAPNPKNGMLRPGKGLRGRYWRMKIRNQKGCAFSVDALKVQLFIEQRSWNG